MAGAAGLYFGGADEKAYKRKFWFSANRVKSRRSESEGSQPEELGGDADILDQTPNHALYRYTYHFAKG